MPVQSYSDVQNELNKLRKDLETLNDMLVKDTIILDHIGRIKTIIRLIDNNKFDLILKYSS